MGGHCASRRGTADDEEDVMRVRNEGGLRAWAKIAGALAIVFSAGCGGSGGTPSLEHEGGSSADSSMQTGADGAGGTSGDAAMGMGDSAQGGGDSGDGALGTGSDAADDSAIDGGPCPSNQTACSGGVCTN